MTSTIYDEQVKDLLKGISRKVKVTQTKKYTYLNTLTKKMSINEMYMSNDIMRNRKMVPHDNVQTTPYGFPRRE